MDRALEGRRVLVVEDEFLIAMEIEDVLRALGAEVVGPFGRLEPAFEALRQGNLHGAVLDVQLDGDTSDRLAAELATRGVPVLLSTGFESEQLPPDLRHLPRLRKPFDEGDLRNMIEQTCR